MRLLALSLLTTLLLFSTALADNWPNWRGPTYNGVAPGKGFPTKWSAKENVAWKVELPGQGASTPIVWEDRIFLTAGIRGQNTVLCYDRSGKEQWQAAIGKERPGKNKKATGANPSIVTDGEYLFAYFKSGDLACLDYTGKVVWHKNLQDLYGEDTLWWDLGTSPVLTKQHLVVAVMHSGPSFLAALEKATGEEAWKQDRNLGAPSESAQSYTTPVVLERDGKEELVVLGADHVTGHDGATGKELWRVGGLNPTGNGFFRSIASPVVSDGVVIAPYARQATLTAIRLGGQGDVTKSHVLWTKEGSWTDVPTPAAEQGKVYVCTDKGPNRGTIVCLDVTSGKELWRVGLEKPNKEYSASPILADGKLYITREDSKTFVLDVANKGKVIAENELEGEFVVATPVLVDGQILIRTLESLYCIGKE